MKRGAMVAFASLAALSLAAPGAPAADLGFHGLSQDNTCRVCHNTAKGVPTLRGWSGASLPDISGTAWAGRRGRWRRRGSAWCVLADYS